MCLSIPAEIINIDKDKATVSVGGTRYQADISMVDGVIPGDFILLHSGYAIGKIDAAKALQTLSLMAEIKRKAGD